MGSSGQGLSGCATCSGYRGYDSLALTTAAAKISSATFHNLVAKRNPPTG
jgi:hypothetical protein